MDQEIRALLSEMESAADEESAALAYRSLKSCIENYLVNTELWKEELFRLKNTIARQAKDITELSIEAAMGGPAPGESPTIHNSPPQNPEVLTVQNTPDFFFIRLSYGLVNIRHIVELDAHSRTLFTTQGTRNLLDKDVQTLLFHLNLYRPA